MDRFNATTGDMDKIGDTIISQSDEFRYCVKQIYDAVEKMVNSNYIDPAAREIATKIQSYRDVLNQIAIKIEEHGNFFKLASTKTLANQENNKGLLK